MTEQEELDSLIEDAERWRALMSSQRIRVMGAAGMQWHKQEPVIVDFEHVHIGVEFWSTHSAAHPSREFPQEGCRAAFTAYADFLRGE
jgi:hypothetical protein